MKCLCISSISVSRSPIEWEGQSLIALQDPRLLLKRTLRSQLTVQRKRLLEELTQLSKELEEEKEKCRRLRKENASLDIELELIDEKLK